MPVFRPVTLLVAALLGLGAATAPAAEADTGGTPAPDPVAAGDHGLEASAHVLRGEDARFRGRLPVTAAGGQVAVQRLDAATGTWEPLATALVAADGTYFARWRTDRPGRHRLRAQLLPGAAAIAATASPEVDVTVYAPYLATWYGPGFFGRRTACGRRMSSTLLGVAHKTLPCRTLVALSFRGRSITVPVVDRGPFRPGKTWDLTAATADALGFRHTARIGAAVIARPQASR